MKKYWRKIQEGGLFMIQHSFFLGIIIICVWPHLRISYDTRQILWAFKNKKLGLLAG